LQYYHNLNDPDPAGTIDLTEDTDVDFYHETEKTSKFRFILTTYEDLESFKQGEIRKVDVFTNPPSALEPVPDHQETNKKEKEENEDSTDEDEDLEKSKIKDPKKAKNNKHKKIEKTKQKIVEKVKKLNDTRRIYILAASKAEERKVWMFAIWKVILDIQRAKGSKGIKSSPQSIEAAAEELVNLNHAANHQDALRQIHDNQLEAKRSVWNWLKHKHKLISLRHDHARMGLPWPARVYLFCVDLIFNLFFTLTIKSEFNYTLLEQFYIAVPTLLFVSWVLRLWIFRLLDWHPAFKFSSLLFLIILLPVSFILGSTMYIIQIGNSATGVAGIQIAINMFLSWVIELILLFVVYYIVSYCFKWITLDDKLADMLKEKKKRRRGHRRAKTIDPLLHPKKKGKHRS